MSIVLKSIKELSKNGVKIFVYGWVGSGKTSLIKTLPNPIILSAEGGMLSLHGCDLPVYEIATMDDLREAYSAVYQSDYSSIALDSISEIAEVVLNNEKRIAKDPRQAYGAMQEQVTELIRAFRDIPGKNVYFSAKQERATDDMGRLLYSPSMPGTKLGSALPYFFDEVLCARVEKDPSSGEDSYFLQCKPDGIYEAKDRSGKLDKYEPSDLGAIIKKIDGKK